MHEVVDLQRFGRGLESRFFYKFLCAPLFYKSLQFETFYIHPLSIYHRNIDHKTQNLFLKFAAPHKGQDETWYIVREL